MLSEEEIIGMSEAYKSFMLLTEEAQKLVPKEFVEEMKKYYKEELGAKIKSFEDINADNVSKEGLKKMAYIRSFL